MSFIRLKNLRSLIAVVIAMVMAVQASSSVNAGLMISIPNVTIAPGGSGYLDVLIKSDGTDSFQNYFLDFTISGAAQAADPINFVASIITAPQLSAMSPDYIFLGDSAEFNAPIGIDFVTDQPGSPIANDLISVTDATFSLADRTIISADGNFLLARLNFIAPLTATPGNVYDIKMDTVTSFFKDALANPVTFSSSIGSITISSAAVPEPASFVVLGLVAAVGGYVRRRKNAASRDSSLAEVSDGEV